MGKMTAFDGEGPLDLVTAIWVRAWMDVCLGPGKTAESERRRAGLRAAAWEFMLDEGALDNLAAVGPAEEVMKRMVREDIDVVKRRYRDVVKMWEGGVVVADIGRELYGRCTTWVYEDVKRVIMEVGGDH